MPRRGTHGLVYFDDASIIESRRNLKQFQKLSPQAIRDEMVRTENEIGAALHGIHMEYVLRGLPDGSFSGGLIQSARWETMADPSPEMFGLIQVGFFPIKRSATPFFGSPERYIPAWEINRKPSAVPPPTKRIAAWADFRGIIPAYYKQRGKSASARAARGRSYQRARALARSISRGKPGKNTIKSLAEDGRVRGEVDRWAVKVLQNVFRRSKGA